MSCVSSMAGGTTKNCSDLQPQNPKRSTKSLGIFLAYRVDLAHPFFFSFTGIRRRITDTSGVDHRLSHTPAGGDGKDRGQHLAGGRRAAPRRSAWQKPVAGRWHPAILIFIDRFLFFCFLPHSRKSVDARIHLFRKKGIVSPLRSYAEISSGASSADNRITQCPWNLAKLPNSATPYIFSFPTQVSVILLIPVSSANLRPPF